MASAVNGQGTTWLLDWLVSGLGVCKAKQVLLDGGGFGTVTFPQTAGTFHAEPVGGSAAVPLRGARPILAEGPEVSPGGIEFGAISPEQEILRILPGEGLVVGVTFGEEAFGGGESRGGGAFCRAIGEATETNGGELEAAAGDIVAGFKGVYSRSELGPADGDGVLHGEVGFGPAAQLGEHAPFGEVRNGEAANVAEVALVGAI